MPIHNYSQITVQQLPEAQRKLGITAGGVPSTRLISTSSPLTGGGDLSADRTIGIPASTDLVNGYLTSIDHAAFSAKESVLTFNSPLSRAVNTVSIPVATSLVNGYLSAADFVVFSAKVSSTRAINTTAPLVGGGDLSADRTLAIAKSTAVVDGYLAAADFATFAAKESALTFSAPLARAVNTISMPVATSLANGYLSSTDWSTFNNKVSTSRTLNTTAPITGGGDLSADRTFAMAKSTASVDGYLAAADFTTFTNKLNLSGGTLTGNLLFSADNTLDVGAIGATRPRTGYFGTSLVVGGTSAQRFTISSGNWFTSPVALFRSTVASTPGVLDVLANGTGQDSWMDVGSDFTIDNTNGEFIEIRKVNNSYGAITVKPLGTGTARDLVLQRAGVNATGKLGIFLNTPTEEIHAKRDQNLRTLMSLENANSGTAAWCAIEARNGTSSNECTRIDTMGVNFTTNGAFASNSGGLETGSSLSGGMFLVCRATGAKISFYTEGFATSNLASTLGTKAFTLNNTFTSATNFERLDIQFASNVAQIWTEKGSGGGTARDLVLGADATEVIRCQTGTKLGFYGVTPVARSSAYSITNVTTDRAYDANATSLDEIADVLGTLVSDLRAVGLLT